MPWLACCVLAQEMRMSYIHTYFCICLAFPYAMHAFTHLDLHVSFLHHRIAPGQIGGLTMGRTTLRSRSTCSGCSNPLATRVMTHDLLGLTSSASKIDASHMHRTAEVLTLVVSRLIGQQHCQVVRCPPPLFGAVFNTCKR